MRKIIDVQPCFFINLFSAGKMVTQYREKYEKIDVFLDKNQDILARFHEDLKEFCSSKERETNYSSEQIFRMIIVKRIEELPYRKCIIRVTESEFLRNFTRLGISKVLSYGLLCAAEKMIQPSTWKKINSLLIDIIVQENKSSGDYFRLDSTVSETNIHFPTDNGLLWDSYRVISRIIRKINKADPLYNIGNRFHDKKIKKLYTYIATHSSGKKKSVKKNVKRFMKILIERVDNLCEATRIYLDHSYKVVSLRSGTWDLLTELELILPLARQVVTQAYRSQVLDVTVPASDRIFSIFEEHTELLKRGKAGKPVEFGHLVTLGQTKEKFISFYDVQAKSLHDTEMKEIALETHKEQFGSYPNKFTADKNYWVGSEDIKKYEEEMELCAIAKKGRRNQAEYDREHSDDFKFMQRFRAGIEGSISVLKRVFGLDICRNRGFKSFASSLGSLVFCHNLVLL